MKKPVVLVLIMTLWACVANFPADIAQTEPDTAEKATAENTSDPPDPTKPIKSPHGHILTKDYEPGRFGGFIGDCSDDKNWPYYWQCMSENSGNGFR